MKAEIDFNLLPHNLKVIAIAQKSIEVVKQIREDKKKRALLSNLKSTTVIFPK